MWEIRLNDDLLNKKIYQCHLNGLLEEFRIIEVYINKSKLLKLHIINNQTGVFNIIKCISAPYYHSLVAEPKKLYSFVKNRNQIKLYRKLILERNLK